MLASVSFRQPIPSILAQTRDDSEIGARRRPQISFKSPLLTATSARRSGLGGVVQGNSTFYHCLEQPIWYAQRSKVLPPVDQR